jgi:hypothetical protein
MERPMHEAGLNPGLVLIYTSVIMMVLRFFAGPIVHKLSPIGLLLTCSGLTIVGLLALSRTGSSGLAAIFAAATLYGVGKTFFWPTMLGVTAEQCPKGGALTLNAISGIGMIAVGVLGFPLIGAVQENTTSTQLAATAPQVAETVTVQKKYLQLIEYTAVDPAKVATFTDAEATAALASANQAGQFDALGKIAWFPTFMFVCYLGLFFYFRKRGGYRAVELGPSGQKTGERVVRGADQAIADGVKAGGEA